MFSLGEGVATTFKVPDDLFEGGRRVGGVSFIYNVLLSIVNVPLD
jgi:hypothetical protein